MHIIKTYNVHHLKLGINKQKHGEKPLIECGEQVECTAPNIPYFSEIKLVHKHGKEI